MMGHFRRKRFVFERKVITVSSSSVGSLGHLLDKIRPNIFGFVFKFDTSGHSHTVLRDPGIPTTSLNYHIATLIQSIQNKSRKINLLSITSTPLVNLCPPDSSQPKK